MSLWRERATYFVAGAAIVGSAWAFVEALSVAVGR
jgi:hypothetical protein